MKRICIGRKAEEDEQEGRSKEDELGERERKVRKEEAKEMNWEKGRGR